MRFRPLSILSSILPAGGPGEASVWELLRQRRAMRWSLRMLWVLLFFAVFADFIANEKPLYCRIEGQTYFPVLRHYLVEAGWARWDGALAGGDWKNLSYERVVFPPIPYSPQALDKKNFNYVSPFGRQRVESWRYRHWMGTDQIGRDVAAGMIWGARTAMLVGLVSMGVALLIGILLGAVAGFFGDRSLKVSIAGVVLNLIVGAAGLFYATVPGPDGAFRGWGQAVLIFATILLIANALSWLLSKNPFLKRRVYLPADMLVLRLIEVMNSIPALLLLLSVAAVLHKPSLLATMLIIGLIRWTGIARFIRAELLRIRSLGYIESARVLGLSEWRILWRHAAPNALGPVLIALAFGIAGAILLEAFLSFLGIGLSPEEVTWGTMLNVARSNFRAWWLALGPGLAIFITVTIFNLLGEGLSEAMNPQRRSRQG